MMENVTRELKGILIANDLSDNSFRATRSDSLTLQHYQFDCEKPRNEYGMPYGRTLPSTLAISVKVLDNDDCHAFFNWLLDCQIHDFSIVFNATYDESKNLKDWEASLIAKGYVVEVQQESNKWNSTQPEDRQMIVTIKVLLSEIRFLSENGTNDKIIDIIH